MKTLVMTDVETTGLNPWGGDLLLEIAVILVDAATLEEIPDSRFHRVIKPSVGTALAYATADEFVRDMHTKTGLWDRLDQGTPLEQVDQELAEHLTRHIPNRRDGIVTGNSVRLDMNFMERYLPESMQHLHYRFIDVSSVSSILESVHGLPRLEKHSDHTAMTDIEECLRELRYAMGAIPKLRTATKDGEPQALWGAA